MGAMETKDNVPCKPGGWVWAFSLVLIAGGLMWLQQLLARSYITVGTGPPGRMRDTEYYSGSLAVLVIAVSLSAGLFLFVWATRRWRAHRRSLRDGTKP